MKQHKIMFDIDGVLADFVLGFTRRGEQMFGAYPMTTQRQRWYDDFGGLSPERIQQVWRDIDTSRDFWADLIPMVSPETRSRIAMLSVNDQVAVYFVTSRGRGIHTLRQTQTWVDGWFGESDTNGYDLGHNISVIVSPGKGEAAKMLNADFAIDDKAGNAVYIAYHTRDPHTRQPGTQSYILDRLYNRFDHAALGSNVKRVPTVELFLDDVEAALDAATPR